MLGALQALASLELEGSLAKLTSHFVGGLSAVRADASLEEVVGALKVAEVGRCELAGRALPVDEEEPATFFALAGVGEILAGQALPLAEVVSFAELAGVFGDCAITWLADTVEEDRVLAALAGSLASRSAVLANRKHYKPDEEEESDDFHSVYSNSNFKQ